RANPPRRSLSTRVMSNTYVRRSTRSAQWVERGERRISPALQDERCKERGRRGCEGDAEHGVPGGDVEVGGNFADQREAVGRRRTEIGPRATHVRRPPAREVGRRGGQ